MGGRMRNHQKHLQQPNLIIMLMVSTPLIHPADLEPHILLGVNEAQRRRRANWEAG
jgi:hypothetical protein